MRLFLIPRLKVGGVIVAHCLLMQPGDSFSDTSYHCSLFLPLARASDIKPHALFMPIALAFFESHA